MSAYLQAYLKAYLKIDVKAPLLYGLVPCIRVVVGLLMRLQSISTRPILKKLKNKELYRNLWK